MNYLFSKSSLQVLESLSFTDTIYAFDFDGTLAPIVDDPNKAAMSPTTHALLSKLSNLVPTAIISGRSIADVRPRIPNSVPFVIGNHGLEGLPGITDLRELSKQCAGWKKILKKNLGPKCEELGITIEDKEYSLALHYRQSRKKKLARAAIIKAIRELNQQPRVIYGKLVFNVIPPNGPHKGMALMRLCENAKTRFSFYIGDDDTDEDVFSLLDSNIFSVKVGKKWVSQAKFFINRQSDINMLLKKLILFQER